MMMFLSVQGRPVATELLQGTQSKTESVQVKGVNNQVSARINNWWQESVEERGIRYSWPRGPYHDHMTGWSVIPGKNSQWSSDCRENRWPHGRQWMPWSGKIQLCLRWVLRMPLIRTKEHIDVWTKAHEGLDHKCSRWSPLPQERFNSALHSP